MNRLSVAIVVLCAATVQVSAANIEGASSLIKPSYSQRYNGIADVRKKRSNPAITSSSEVTEGTTCACGCVNKQQRGSRGLSASAYTRNVNKNEFPWMVLLEVYNEEFTKGMLCGGTIITRRHILTAAHCLVRNFVVTAKSIHVNLGEHNRLNKTGKQVAVQKCYIHEKYAEEKRYDIAIIITKDNITYTKEISPIYLSPVGLKISYKDVYYYGWGQMINGKMPDILREGRVMILNWRDCGLKNWEICSDATHTSTGLGDSGGPLVWRDPVTKRCTQVSIHSRGAYDHRDGPDIGINVTFFYSWIQDIITESDPEQNLCTIP